MSVIGAKFRELFSMLEGDFGEVRREDMCAVMEKLPLLHSKREILEILHADAHSSFTYDEFESVLRKALIDMKLDDVCNKFKQQITLMASAQSHHMPSYSDLEPDPYPPPPPSQQQQSTTELMKLINQLQSEKEALERRVSDLGRDLENKQTQYLEATNGKHQIKEEADQLRENFTGNLQSMKDEIERLRFRDWVQSNEMEKKDKDIERLQAELEKYAQREKQWKIEHDRHREREQHYEATIAKLHARGTESSMQELKEEMEKVRAEFTVFARNCEDAVRLAYAHQQHPQQPQPHHHHHPPAQPPPPHHHHHPIHHPPPPGVMDNSPNSPPASGGGGGGHYHNGGGGPHHKHSQGQTAPNGRGLTPTAFTTINQDFNGGGQSSGVLSPSHHHMHNHHHHHDQPPPPVGQDSGSGGGGILNEEDQWYNRHLNRGGQPTPPNTNNNQTTRSHTKHPEHPSSPFRTRSPRAPPTHGSSSLTASTLNSSYY
eukprot:TRINITY_DN32677_c0_g1_i1.p1 TRINITY_DN32677_c0_g1~~TRINITY_DN32677_c0_g1_i1.p1  ORF type:complete len:487 (-),score=87.33 TRINITY_DN32677_c0_g1_i1:99-1559(-)